MFAERVRGPLFGRDARWQQEGKRQNHDADAASPPPRDHALLQGFGARCRRHRLPAENRPPVSAAPRASIPEMRRFTRAPQICWFAQRPNTVKSLGHSTA